MNQTQRIDGLGTITLIGCNHLERNYERVMRILEYTKPAFVSQEVRLFHELSRAFEPVLRASLPELNSIESRILLEGSYAAEYEAGIIYCRRNNLPLYWTDLYYAMPQEVVDTNVLDVKPSSLLWVDDRDIPARLLEKNTESGEQRYFDISERNVFTGGVLLDLLRMYAAGDGVHICGKNHYNPRIRMPLQVILNASLSKPSEILFEPRIDG